MSDIYDEYREPPRGCGEAIAGGIALICLVVLLFFSSCKSPAPIVQTVETTDTNDITVRTRDIPVTIEADSASILALLRCDSAYNVVLDELATMQGERIKANANVKAQPDGGMLIDIDCKEDSLQQIIHAQDSIIKSLRTTKETVYVPVEKPISDYYKNTSTGFWILLVILVAIGAFKAYKLYLKIQTGGLSSILKL